VQSKFQEKRVGDLVSDRACAHAAYLNQSEFMSSLRTRVMATERYIDMISGTYPIVVSFNRALIRSMSKLDNVRSSKLIKGLAQQLYEEQSHNDMWRDMLKSFDVDHAALYTTFKEYMDSFSTDRLDRMTREVIEALMATPENVAPGVFPCPVFPEPALALCHHMFMVARSDAVSFWSHFSSQSAIEMTLYDVVSQSIYPGVVGNPDLDRGHRSTEWWKEHARQASEGGKRSTEEKHLQIARHTLNRSEEANDQAKDVLRITEETLRLFSASFVCYDAKLRQQAA
jgi:hypothetical protein